MKRIAILSVHTSPTAPHGGKKIGGMNTYVREIARAFGSQNIIVDVFTRRISPDQPTVDTTLGENVHVVNLTAGISGNMFPLEIYPHLQEFTSGIFAYAIRNNIRYDLVFGHYWLSGWVGQKLKEAWGIPFVQLFHTLGHLKNQLPSIKSHEPEVRTHVETQTVLWADTIIANTPAEAKYLQQLYHADYDKILVCPPGVDIDRFYPMNPRTIREDLNRAEHERLLLFVGRIEPLKAIDSIIEALYIIKLDYPEFIDEISFVVIGGDPNDETDEDMLALQQLTRELELESTVHFLGAKDQATVAKWYVASSVVILPSEYESFGMVALEAMATGTPVIVSDVGGLPFLVDNLQTGFLVPSRNPEQLASRIVNLLENPVLQQDMGEKAAMVALEYSWENIAKRLVKHFNKLLSR